MEIEISSVVGSSQRKIAWRCSETARYVGGVEKVEVKNKRKVP
jgi:hypothetical protein